MKNSIIGAALLAIAAGASAGTPEIIAYWAQNNNGLSGGSGFGFEVGDFPQGADFGTQAGSANLTVGGGDALANDGTLYTWLQSFTGSGINAQFGEPSGGSIAIQGGTDQINNGAYFELNFNAGDYQDISFSMARQATGSGFTTVAIDAYDNGALLGNIGSINTSGASSFAFYEFGTNILDGVDNATIRLTFTGATGSTGNNRLDNLVISGALIPTPGAAALMGLGGLVAARRRRA